MKRIILLILIVLMFTGCSTNTKQVENNDEENSIQNTNETNIDIVSSSNIDTDMFTNRDLKSDYDENDSILIKLNGTTASASSNSVIISGSTITITEEATYIISGSLDDGMIIVDAADSAKLQLVLNGVNINSNTSAPLYILEADKVFLTLANNTENTLSNDGSFTAIDENNIDGVIFSKQDLTLNGSGSLTISSYAGHGIVCKDDLVFTGGTYTIESSSHGLDVNDSVRITGETNITIDAGKDGIHCENDDDTSLGFIYISNGKLNIDAEGDCIDAGYYVQIEGGNFGLLAGGGSVNASTPSSSNFGNFKGNGMRFNNPQNMPTTDSEDSTSMKAIKANDNILISGGTFVIDSADDGIHSNLSVTINGGVFEIATGDDGMHADENLSISEGNINITKSYEGLEALCVDIQGGEIKLISSDDGINAAGGIDNSGISGGRDGMFNQGKHGMGMSVSSSGGSVLISGGNIYVVASGDGIDANGSIEISGGYTVVVGPSQGDTATLDYDTSALISGGTFIGTGGAGMAQTFSDCKQGVVAVSVGNQSAGTNIVLEDKNGNKIFDYTPELNFAVVILSSPEIISNETYKISVGSQSGEFQAS